MSRTMKILIAFLLLDILVAGFLWYGYTGMQDKKTEQSGLRKDIAAEEEKGRQMIALRRTADLSEPDRKALEQYLFDPSDESLIKFISQMEQLGITTTGALVETHSLDKSSARVHGEFAITGTWSQLYHLLRIIEALPTRVVITQFNISRRADVPAGAIPGTESWNGNLSIDITSLKTQ